MRAVRRRAHTCPVHEGQHILEISLVAQALGEGATSIDAEGNHPSVTLDSTRPRAGVVAQKQPRGAEVLGEEQALHLCQSGERPVVGGELDARRLRALPGAAVRTQP